MRIVEKDCENCGKKIYVRESYLREKMFCTIGCLDQFKESHKDRQIQEL